jgi:hypothetical protein
MTEKYSRLTKDRSGAQIQDMLFAYAKCHKNNIIYKGARDHEHVRDRDNERLRQTIGNTTSLCNLLGLPVPIIDDKLYDGDKIITDYGNDNTNDTFNLDFIKMLHNNAKKNFSKIKLDKNDFVVSIHIRRGDVKQDNKWFFRYVSDEYYLKILNAIIKIKPNAKIYLFSDGNENFKEFEKIGCTLKINSDIVEAWNYFIQSDILIMGSSSFSIVPGIYNINGVVVYTWNKYFKPLNHWISDECLEAKIQKITNKIK